MITKILGSQFGIILFMKIGGIVIYIINKASKEKMSSEDVESTMGCFIVAGIIFAFVCFFLYECTHPED